MRPNFSIGIIARIMGNPRSMFGSAPSESWTARIGIFRPSPSGCDGRPIGDTNFVLSVTTQFSTPASSNLPPSLVWNDFEICWRTWVVPLDLPIEFVCDQYERQAV